MAHKNLNHPRSCVSCLASIPHTAPYTPKINLTEIAPGLYYSDAPGKLSTFLVVKLGYQHLAVRAGERSRLRKDTDIITIYSNGQILEESAGADGSMPVLAALADQRGVA